MQVADLCAVSYKGAQQPWYECLSTCSVEGYNVINPTMLLISEEPEGKRHYHYCYVYFLCSQLSSPFGSHPNCTLYNQKLVLVSLNHFYSANKI